MINIEPCSSVVASQLAESHYITGRPGPVVQCFRAVCDDAPELTAGVLTLSMPVLNGPWRALAWPALLEGADKRQRASRLNVNLRTISRVLVDPRFRGRGIGSALVRHAIAHAQVPLVEAIASMAVLVPLFSAAGMRRIEPPETLRASKLRLALDQAQLTHDRLIEADTVSAIAFATAGPLAALASALRAWARNSRGTRRLITGPFPALCQAAARGLAPKAIYVHGQYPPVPATLQEAAS